MNAVEVVLSLLVVLMLVIGVPLAQRGGDKPSRR